MQLNRRLDTFELKLRQLASKFERQETEKMKLLKENAELKRELDRQRGVVSSLKERLERAISSDQKTETSEELTRVGENEVVATRAQIDACIVELDRCIEWLEKH
ncbi:hypothetical protein CEQ90_07170 [Lewinellaceae bacterium SD302]|nr:hypothetical protein CEQ90_07170 [Lewinellaceae bacterium SD302]